MASQYFAILTDYGTGAFANALTTKQPLQLTTFAVGDGNGQAVTPTANRTALAREKHRAAVSAVSLDPRNNKQVIVELTIPENIGGFYIREMGVFDNQNKLIAYANCPESFKPTESSGSGKVQVLRMILKVSSSSAVTLRVDHSVIFVTRQQLTPKTITAATQNGFDESGHSHEIDRATTAKAGIVQLNSATNSPSETEAATPKAVKTVKDRLDSVSRNQANYIPNSKKSSSLTSSSADTVATSSAVKQLNDQITPLNFYKVNVKAGNTPVTFDLSNREHWIAEIGSVYKGTGHYQLGLHNTAISTISNLPLNDKSAVQLDISVMGAYSLIRCHYLALNRTFTSRFDWNKSTFPLAWFEEVKLDSNGKVPRETVFARSLESNYRVVIRRDEAKYTPYQMLVDNSVDMTAETVPQKSIGELTCRAGAGDGVLKSLLKTILLADKNATIEMGGWDASQRYKIFLKGFTKTNNVVIGSGADNARDLLQVNGTVKATAPADSANNDQVPNTFWVRRLLNNAVSMINNAIAGKVSKSGDSMTGMLTLPKLSLTQRNIAFGDDYLYKNNANNAQHGFHLFEDSGEPNDNKKGNARFFVNEIRANHIGQGMYAGQYHSFAPFFVDESGSVSRDTYHPFVKGKVRSANQYGAAFSLGYTTYQGAQGTDGWGKGVIHLIEDNGKEQTWTFEHNGNFWSPGDVITGRGHSLNACRETLDNFIASNEYIKNLTPGNKIMYRWTGSELQLRIDNTEFGAVALLSDVRNVSRVNKSTIIRGTNTEDSGNTRNISLTGMVMTHPDGRIVQILHLRNFRMIWFALEQPGVGGYGGGRGYHISLPLWTAMPNKIVNVNTQLMRATGSASATYGSEGGEWVSAWQLWGKENEKSWVNINLNRIGGGSSEPIDLYVVVEGY